MTEREVKLPVPSRWSLPDLALPAHEAVSFAHRYLDAVYYDTPDLRLARWDVCLRYRTGEGWTVKLPAAGELRREIRFAGRWNVIPEAARELTKVFARQAPLVPVARLRTTRKPTVLFDGAGRQVLEVVDDLVSAYHGPGPAEQFREVEIELAEGTDPAVLEQVIDRLRRSGAGPTSTLTKLARALGPAALRQPDVVVPLLPEEPSAGDVMRAGFARSVARFITFMPGVYLDEDPEDLHQARVATRRLRSDLRTFGPLLVPDWAEPLGVELRWLADALGAVRDADVLLLRLGDTALRLPDAAAGHADDLIDALEADRSVAYSELLEAVREERYGALLDRMVEAANQPALEATAEQSATGVLAQLASGPFDHLRQTVLDLPADPEDDDLHRIRICAKRTRYAAEAVVPVYGKQAARFARAAARLQDTLGELQDASVARDWLANTAAGHPRAAFTAGQLAGFELVRAEQARAGWPDVWRKLSRKKLRAWM